jgi:hypothetical protein
MAGPVISRFAFPSCGSVCAEGVVTESERKFDDFWAEQEVAGASSDELDDAERSIGYALPP